MQEYARLIAAETAMEIDGEEPSTLESSPNKPTVLFDTPVEGGTQGEEEEESPDDSEEGIDDDMERGILDKGETKEEEANSPDQTHSSDGSESETSVASEYDKIHNKLQQSEAKPARRSKRVALRERLLAKEDDGRASLSDDSGSDRDNSDSE